MRLQFLPMARVCCVYAQAGGGEENEQMIPTESDRTEQTDILLDGTARSLEVRCERSIQLPDTATSHTCTTHGVATISQFLLERSIAKPQTGVWINRIKPLRPLCKVWSLHACLLYGAQKQMDGHNLCHLI